MEQFCNNAYIIKEVLTESFRQWGKFRDTFILETILIEDEDDKELKKWQFSKDMFIGYDKHQQELSQIINSKKFNEDLL